MTKKRNRPDMDGKFQSAYEKNRRVIIAESEVCAICGLPLIRGAKFPDPMSTTVDHIIPIAKGGHPSALDNLQAAHLICNQVKGTRLVVEQNKNIQKEAQTISNRVLPLTIDWKAY